MDIIFTFFKDDEKKPLDGLLESLRREGDRRLRESRPRYFNNLNVPYFNNLNVPLSQSYSLMLTTAPPFRSPNRRYSFQKHFNLSINYDYIYTMIIYIYFY